MRAHPQIIQGGMGIGVSNWRLARAVSMRRELGVVSGTCIDTVFVRRLQDGDPGGHMRRAAASFPLHEVAEATIANYYRPEGRGGAPYRMLPMWRESVGRAREQLTMLASFVEVHLARQEHEGEVGINLLTKVQLPNLATLYGAMLAGVDYVIMGAGIPREIPGVLDAFAAGAAATSRLDVEDNAGHDHVELRFDPAEHFDQPPSLRRPKFLPVVASHALATMLVRKSNGRVDGFVVEGPTAGGHNAPPRGRPELSARGEPVYGERDVVDLKVMRELALPFWLAGGMGSREQLEYAVSEGAAGVQVGTLFAYAAESGLDAGLRDRVLAKVRAADIDVRTDPRASPTGFPFKVVELEGTNADTTLYVQRERSCDLGYLRNAYRRADGRIGYRCAGEPVSAYVEKGGAADDTTGRKCLCNALMSNIALAQLRSDGAERALLTSGDELCHMTAFASTRSNYTAADVLDYLLGAGCLGASALVEPTTAHSSADAG